MNNITVIGRATRDVTKSNKNGMEYSRFIIAVNRPFAKNNEVDFFNCVAFGKTADVVSQYVKKGDRVGVQGRMQSSHYEKNGYKLTSWELIVGTVDLLGGSQGSQQSQSEPKQAKQVDNEDEFPW